MLPIAKDLRENSPVFHMRGVVVPDLPPVPISNLNAAGSWNAEEITCRETSRR